MILSPQYIPISNPFCELHSHWTKRKVTLGKEKNNSICKYKFLFSIRFLFLCHTLSLFLSFFNINLRHKSLNKEMQFREKFSYHQSSRKESKFVWVNLEAKNEPSLLCLCIEWKIREGIFSFRMKGMTEELSLFLSTQLASWESVVCSERIKQGAMWNEDVVQTVEEFVQSCLSIKRLRMTICCLNCHFLLEEECLVLYYH